MMLNDEQIEQVRIDRERLHARTLNTNPEWLKFERERQAKFNESMEMTKPKGVTIHERSTV